MTDQSPRVDEAPRERRSGCLLASMAILLVIVAFLVALFWRSAWWMESGPPP